MISAYDKNISQSHLDSFQKDVFYGYVYVLGFSNGAVKIGKTCNPKQRFDQHKNSAGMIEDISTEWVSPIHFDPSKKESDLKQFIGGKSEWTKLHDVNEVINFAKSLNFEIENEDTAAARRTNESAESKKTMDFIFEMVRANPDYVIRSEINSIFLSTKESIEYFSSRMEKYDEKLDLFGCDAKYILMDTWVDMISVYSEIADLEEIIKRLKDVESSRPYANSPRSQPPRKS